MKYDTNINKNNNNGNKQFKYNTDLNRMKNANKPKEEISIKGALIFIGIVFSVIFIYGLFEDSLTVNYDKNDYDDAVKYLQDSINSQK